MPCNSLLVDTKQSTHYNALCAVHVAGPDRTARVRSGRLGMARDGSGWVGMARDGSGWDRDARDAQDGSGRTGRDGGRRRGSEVVGGGRKGVAVGGHSL